jgi:diketogulonate reductase-like aldo/keto reductase
VAWVLSRGYRYIPIVGARKPAQIIDVMGAADLKLPEGALKQLDELTAVELGFPHDFLRSDHLKDMSKGEVRRKIDFRPREP